MDKEQQAIERLREYAEWARANEWEVPLCMADDLEAAVDKLTADVAPVRHGRWEEADWVEPDCHSFGTIRTPKAALRCSNCKNCFKKELLWKDNYCPNCGAKMDEEVESE